MESSVERPKWTNRLLPIVVTVLVLLVVVAYSPLGKAVLGKLQNQMGEYYASPGAPFVQSGYEMLNSPYGFVRVKAVSEFTKAIKLDPNYAAAYYARAYAWIDAGLPAATLKDLNKAIELKPDYFAALEGRGVEYLILRQWDKALADLNKAVSLMPGDVDPETAAKCYMLRGQALLGLDRLDEAMVDFNKSLAINPTYSLTYINLGQLYRKQGMLKAAVSAYLKSTELQPPYDLSADMLALQKLLDQETDAETRAQAEQLMAKIQRK